MYPYSSQSIRALFAIFLSFHILKGELDLEHDLCCQFHQWIRLWHTISFSPRPAVWSEYWILLFFHSFSLQLFLELYCFFSIENFLHKNLWNKCFYSFWFPKYELTLLGQCKIHNCNSCKLHGVLVYIFLSQHNWMHNPSQLHIFATLDYDAEVLVILWKQLKSLFYTFQLIWFIKT